MRLSKFQSFSIWVFGKSFNADCQDFILQSPPFCFAINMNRSNRIPIVSPELVAPRCSAKNVFLKISQNPQENTCARASFLLKLQASDCNFNKKGTLSEVFSCEFCGIYNTFIYRALPVAASFLSAPVNQTSERCNHYPILDNQFRLHNSIN